MVFKIGRGFDPLLFLHGFRSNSVNGIPVQTYAVQFGINLVGNDDRGIDNIAQQVFGMARCVHINVEFRE